MKPEVTNSNYFQCINTYALHGNFRSISVPLNFMCPKNFILAHYNNTILIIIVFLIKMNSYYIIAKAIKYSKCLRV